VSNVYAFTSTREKKSLPVEEMRNFDILLSGSVFNIDI
jgi:hypothetical protein